MEMRRYIQSIISRLRIFVCCLLLCTIITTQLHAQPAIKKYTLVNGNMQVSLGKGLADKELDEFIDQYDLKDLSLKLLITVNFQDSLVKQGWRVEVNNKEMI